MFAATASAEWTKPVLQTQDIVTDGTTEQYLYNVETGRFAIAGNDWQTRASAETAGATWKIQVADADNGTYSLIDYVAKFKEYRKTFVDGPAAIWCDNNTGANCDSWTLTPVGDGNYLIGNTAFPDQYVGAQLDGADTRLYLTSYFTEKVIDAGYTWTSVSKEAYDNFAPEVKRYETAMKLKDALDDIKATYPSVDVAAEQAVYDNESSTQKELDDAIAAVVAKKAKAIAEEAEAAASIDNPLDMTSSITNPSFEDGKTTGWTYSKSGAFGDAADGNVQPNSNATYTCKNTDGAYLFNTWAWGYPITQKLSNMPNGIYALEAMVASSDDCTNVYTTAETSYRKFKNAITLEAGEGFNKQTWGTRGSFLFPVGDGEFTIGAVGADADGKSYLEGGRWWYKVDDFKLTYYGNKPEAWQYGWVKYAEKAEEPSEEIMISDEAYDAYDKARSPEIVVENFEQYAAAVNALDEAVEKMNENIALWQQLAEEVAKAKSVVNGEGVDKSNDDVLALIDYVNSKYPDLSQNTGLTSEDVKNEIQKVKDMQEAVKNALTKGADVTSYLVNPDFSKGKEGWNGDPTINSSCGEKYNSGVFDVYQEVKDLPVGLYEISVQGFYRQYRDDGSGADAFKAWNNIFEDTEDARTFRDPAPDPLAFVYMNDMKTPLETVYKYAQPIDGVDGEGKSTCSFYGTTDWGADAKNKYAYPNGMSSAAKAFADGAYTVKAYGLVASKEDALRIGVKGELSGPHWAIFDNFKLTYQAKDPEIVNMLLPTISAGLDLTQLMGVEVKAAAQTALETVQTAEDDVQKFNALCEVASASTKIDASVAVFKELAAKYKELDNAFNSSQASDETITACDELLEQIKIATNTATNTLTTAQAQELIDAVPAMIKKLAIPAAIAEASIENPLDMTGFIVNPSFEDGHTTGWTHDKSDGTVQLGPQNNSEFGKTGTYYAEKYHAAGTYQMSQVLSELPSGTYVITVDGHASNGADLFANETTKDFTNLTDAKKPNTEKVCVFINEGETITIGVKGTLTGDTWVCVDNFTLACVGYQVNNVDAWYEANSVEDVKAAADAKAVKVAKILKQGKLVILKDGKFYNAAGAAVK